MKRLVRLAVFGIWIAVATESSATNPAMGLVTHPVNLGKHADPRMIPLSATAVWHNYGYGIHQVISRSRLFPAGGLATPGGVVHEMNLASVFDLQVLPEDETQVPLKPVVLKVGGREVPADSPYTRSQVIEATLWCLVFTAPGSEKEPLVIIIDSPDPEDQKYAGSYVWSPDAGALLLGEIPGSMPVRDHRGVVSIEFNMPADPVDSPADGPRPELAFVPLLSGGGAEGEDRIAMVPHWTGDGGEVAALELPWTAIPRSMNVFSAKRGENANPLHAGPFDTQHPAGAANALGFMGGARGDGELSVDDHRLFAAACHAAVLTVGPSAETPFEISFMGFPPAAWEVLAADDWEASELPHGQRSWSRSFTDADQTILGHRLVPRADGGWWLESSAEDPDTPFPEIRLPDTVPPAELIEPGEE